MFEGRVRPAGRGGSPLVTCVYILVSWETPNLPHVTILHLPLFSLPHVLFSFATRPFLIFLDFCDAGMCVHGGVESYAWIVRSFARWGFLATGDVRAMAVQVRQGLCGPAVVAAGVHGCVLPAGGGGCDLSVGERESTASSCPLFVRIS